MRLDRFICKSTELTRIEAIQQIKLGNAFVNNVAITNEATQVHENNLIFLNDIQLIARDFRYILMHKPAGTICSNIDEVYPSLFNYLNIDRISELHIAGRLDADTTGLVLITDNGRWSYEVTHPTKQCRKVYRVHLSLPITKDMIKNFSNGIRLQGEIHLTQPASIELVGDKEVLLTITEGKFHQVKRMFAAVGNKVVSLHREKIGDITLDVDVGKWRYLTEDEHTSFDKSTGSPFNTDCH